MEVESEVTFSSTYMGIATHFEQTTNTNMCTMTGSNDVVFKSYKIRLMTIGMKI